jgi:hypothetical protein
MKVGPSWFSLAKTELKSGVICQTLLYHYSQTYYTPEVVNKPFSIKAQGETQMQTQEADGWSLTMFIIPKG